MWMSPVLGDCVLIYCNQHQLHTRRLPSKLQWTRNELMRDDEILKLIKLAHTAIWAVMADSDRRHSDRRDPRPLSFGGLAHRADCRGVRRAGAEPRALSAHGPGGPVHCRSRREFRHLPAALACAKQQGDLRKFVCGRRAGLALALVRPLGRLATPLRNWLSQVSVKKKWRHRRVTPFVCAVGRRFTCRRR